MGFAICGQFGVGDAEVVLWRVIRTRGELLEEAARANVGSVLKTSAARIESFIENGKSERLRLCSGNLNREGVFADKVFGLKSLVENENIFAHRIPPQTILPDAENKKGGSATGANPPIRIRGL